MPAGFTPPCAYSGAAAILVPMDGSPTAVEFVSALPSASTIPFAQIYYLA